MFKCHFPSLRIILRGITLKFMEYLSSPDPYEIIPKEALGFGSKNRLIGLEASAIRDAR